jgi:hypothetical protein
MVASVLSKLEGNQLVVLLVLGVPCVLGMLIGLTAVLADHKRKIAAAMFQHNLVQGMLERGMPADEIERVLRQMNFVAGEQPTQAKDRYETDGPATCDVVAQDPDGDWHRAVLLQMDDHAGYVHFVGSDASENTWVEKTKLRFPSSVAFSEAHAEHWPDEYNAQEAIVERDGEWMPAYILMHLDKCYVHFIGTDASENEWVDESRVRFSDQPIGLCGVAAGRRSCGKKEPVPAEV